MHTHGTFSRVEQDLWSQRIGRRSQLCATNRNALTDRKRVDTEVRYAMPIFKYLRIGTHFDDNIIVKMYAVVGKDIVRDDRRASNGEEVAAARNDVADYRIAVAAWHA